MWRKTIRSASSMSSLTNSTWKRWGFSGVVPEVTGRPAYHPATLLKIYLYGYLSIASSRAGGSSTGDPTQHRGSCG